MANYVLDIDIGITSVKVVLLDIRSKTVTNSLSLQTKTAIISDETHVCRVSVKSLDTPTHSRVIGVSGQMHAVIFWKAQKDTSQLITRQDGCCNCNFLCTLPNPDSHVIIATGFDCDTIFWYMRHIPALGFLSDFTVTGTINEYMVSMLCGSENCVCVCACSNLSDAGFPVHLPPWDACFPVHLLPECVPSGCMAVQTCSEWHGVHANTPVGAALGDFQCSVYSCMTNRTDAAQLTNAMPLDFTPPNIADPTSSISYFLYFDGSYLAVAASLNGGNVVAILVAMLSGWMNELELEVSDSSLCALRVDSSDLRVSLTIRGERHNPLSLGSWAVGVPFPITRCSDMKQRVFSLPVEYGQDVDSAVGVVMVFHGRL
uniref:Sedoheptulokinase n=1 Tax=Oncorhynchus tshawytscha TaxID=74940 RepID=A0A8C8GTK1_ONCTS